MLLTPALIISQSLHFLSFPLPNWDFSMGCGQKRKKNRSSLNSPARLRSEPQGGAQARRIGARWLRSDGGETFRCSHHNKV